MWQARGAARTMKGIESEFDVEDCLEGALDAYHMGMTLLFHLLSLLRYMPYTLKPKP
jgi:hypothetical protein